MSLSERKGTNDLKEQAWEDENVLLKKRRESGMERKICSEGRKNFSANLSCPGDE